MRKMYRTLLDRISKLESITTPKTKRVFILKKGGKISDYPREDNSNHKRVFIVRRSVGESLTG